MSRRRSRQSGTQSASRKPLYLIAGLSADVLQEVIARLRERFPQRIFQGTPSRKQDRLLYPPELIDKLVREAASFAIRQRRHTGSRPPAPHSITLLYVPADDSERLLEAFDFAVMPAPLVALQAFGPRGKQHRHDVSLALDVISDALGPNGVPKMALDEVRQRLQRRVDNEALLLPPTNFSLGDRRLWDLFVEFRQGRRPATDRFDELAPRRLTSADIQRLGRDVRHCHVDARGIAFLTANPAAYDGADWEKEEETDRSALMSTLRALYRFGGPLEVGFHHDAQRSDGRPFRNEEFQCCRAGALSLSTGHANIYPNDFVRPGRPK